MKSQGRVLLPSDVLVRMGWPGGRVLEIQEMADGVLLRPLPSPRPMREMPPVKAGS